MNKGQKIQNFTDLNAWKEGHKLTLQVYNITQQFPKYELFGLTNQVRRAAVSVTSNIAEGFSRKSNKEKIYFYSTALGSLTELQSQLMIAKDILYITEEIYNQINIQAITVNKLCNGLIKYSKNQII